MGSGVRIIEDKDYITSNFRSFYSAVQGMVLARLEAIVGASELANG